MSLPLPIPHASQRPFNTGEGSAHFKGHVELDVDPRHGHRDCLTVSRFAQGGKSDADHAVILGDLGDVVGVNVRRPEIHDHDGLFAAHVFPDNRHFDSRNWRARRAAIEEFNRRAEEAR